MKSRSSLAEVAATVLIVAGVLAAAVAYTRTWPPAVIVESGSMMHPDSTVSYGRVGTLDPGDLVLVKRARGLGDVALETNGGSGRYGKSGDVIVFQRDGDPRSVPVIHRAVSYVEVTGEGAERQYRVAWEGSVRTFGADGIALEELGFSDDWPCCPDGRYRPQWSGFLTQGDNPLTNRASDQALGIAPEPVKLEWVRGEARGELPWFGLLKLALAPDINDYQAHWVRVGNAYAPRDCWIMLVTSLVAILALPVGVDVARRSRNA